MTPDDPLAPARGLFHGLLLAAALWAVLLFDAWLVIEVLL